MSKAEEVEKVVEVVKETTAIKIFGLQRSGTNYLTYLISNNFKNVDVLMNKGGWKHGIYCIPWVLGYETHLAILTKNPYSWLRSIYNYWGTKRIKNIGPDLRNVAFEQFVRNRVVFEKQKGIPFLLRASNPIQYWNNMNFHWLTINLSTKKMSIITYEALLQNYSASLLQLSENLQIELISDNFEFVNSTQEFSPFDDQPVKQFTRSDYYKNRQYLRYYSPDLLDFINNQLDHEVMKTLGYTLEVPE